MKLTAYITSFYISLLLSISITAQPVYIGNATNTGSTNISVVNKPAGTSVGDLLIIGLMLSKGFSVTITPPVGWTLIRRTNNSNKVGMATYYKVALAVEPASYSFTLSNNPDWAIGISRITGANTFPINTSAEATGTNNAVAPSITTTFNNSLVLCFYTNDEQATYTAAPGTTEQYDAPNTTSNHPSNMMASYTQVIAGATGTKTPSSSQQADWVAQQVAINDASVGAMPIKLEIFSGEALSSSIQLKWRTSMESNNDYMGVERSENGLDFKEIGKIKGAGTTSSSSDYTFSDNAPSPGINYYRLRQVNFDGVHEYHKTIQVLFKTNSSLQIYPNPTSDILKIDRKNMQAATVMVIDHSGKVIIRKDIAAGTLKYVLSLQTLKSGSYVLQLKQSGKYETRTIIKL